MNSDKKQFDPEKGHKILRKYRWRQTVLIALVLPSIVIAINGYNSFGEVIALFGLSALCAWTIHWTNWINSLIFAIGLPAIMIVITGYHNIWNTLILFGICGFIAWLNFILKLNIKKMLEEEKQDQSF